MKESREAELRGRMLRLWRVMASQISRLFMRHSILVPELEKVLRWEAAQVALTDPEFAMKPEGEVHRQTHSHAAVVTGLTRQEMSRVVEKGETFPIPLDGGDMHRLIRILTAWRTEPEYLDADGVPADLSLNGDEPSFNQLCRRFRRDTPTRSLADALVRNGNAKWVDGNGIHSHGQTLRFLKTVVTPQVMTESGTLLGAQYGSDFLHSLQQRFNGQIDPGPRLRQGYFNDIDPDLVDEAQAALYLEIEASNRRYVECLRPFRTKTGGAGIRLGAGSYSFRDAPLIFDEDETGVSDVERVKQTGEEK